MNHLFNRRTVLNDSRYKVSSEQLKTLTGINMTFKIHIRRISLFMDIKLFTDGEVKFGEYTFTRLMVEDKPMISDLQLSKLLGYKMGARFVRQHMDRNIRHFEKGLHYEDVASLKDDNVKNLLISVGYAKQSITQSKNIYLFTQEGFNLYLQLADVKDDLSVFEEEYFGQSLNVYVNPLRYEKSFSKVLDETLNGLIEFEEQYSCCNNKYRIDFYSKEYNLAIEYDEEHHNHTINTIDDMVREHMIHDELGCKFIRVKKGEELKGINEIFKFIHVHNICKHTVAS